MERRELKPSTDIYPERSLMIFQPSAFLRVLFRIMDEKGNAFVYNLRLVFLDLFNFPTQHLFRKKKTLFCLCPVCLL